MTHEQIIAELVRIWHSPHLDLSLKAGLAEAIEALKETNQGESLVTDSSDACKESESKLDLIRRSDAIEAVAKQWLFEASAESPYVNDDDIGEYRDLARELIAEIPSADAAEVVRCKDCKWHLNGHLCKQLSQYGSIETPPSFYCGFGERRVKHDSSIMDYRRMRDHKSRAEHDTDYDYTARHRSKG